MASAVLIRLRPRGPWRYGPSDGAHDGVDALYRSDRLYSALTLALHKLGFLSDWLEATAHGTKPAITLSSLFPFQGDTLFAIPPATVWPPPVQQVSAPNPVFLAKIRWKAVSFVPLTVIDTLLTGGSILADQWLPDPESRCLLRRDRPSTSPMRSITRRTAAVDRVTHQAHTAAAATGVEFEPGAGLWAVARFDEPASEKTWRPRIEGAFRLLSDSGFGGRRSSGWGQSEAPEFTRGEWPGLLLPKLARTPNEARGSSKFWLLSLYVPGAQDTVDWTNGDYQLLTRAGRVENGAGSGVEKKALRMVAEGSVLAASNEPAGAAVDVAPANFAHPVYRSGLALALELPEISQLGPVEEPATEEAVIDRPCEPNEEQLNIPEPTAETEEPSIGPKPGEVSPEVEAPAETPATTPEENPPDEPTPVNPDVESWEEPKPDLTPEVEPSSTPGPDVSPEVESSAEPRPDVTSEVEPAGEPAVEVSPEVEPTGEAAPARNEDENVGAPAQDSAVESDREGDKNEI